AIDLIVNGVNPVNTVPLVSTDSLLPGRSVDARAPQSFRLIRNHQLRRVVGAAVVGPDLPVAAGVGRGPVDDDHRVVRLPAGPIDDFLNDAGDVGAVIP